jgi:DNA-binding GntR family transcriptional regulator
MEKRRSDIIADTLEERIFDGTYRDGDRLDELTVSEHFGVSRTPIREALQRLAQSNLVQLVPRRGAFVRQPGPVELLEMFEVMAELEAVCARFAAKRISTEALSELTVANKKCQAAVDANLPDVYYTENELFHRIIYRESGNAFLEQETAFLHRRLQPFRRQQLRLRGRMEQSMAEHAAILGALERGDCDRAAAELRNHVAVQGEKFHSLIASLRKNGHSP